MRKSDLTCAAIAPRSFRGFEEDPAELKPALLADGGWNILASSDTPGLGPMYNVSIRETEMVDVGNPTRLK